MKTVAKINPEIEYQNAKKIIELTTKGVLDCTKASSLDSSLEKIITATRVLMEREDRRRGLSKVRQSCTPKNNKPDKNQRKKDREDAKKLPSEKYHNLEIEEKEFKDETPPNCPCCGKVMSESGLSDTSEKLETKPKKYYIVRNKRPKYNCKNCHGSMVNSPAKPSIVPTSNYGDSLIIDVALSKYLDLIPIERYCQIAHRNGLVGLPQNSMIGLTHHLANFLLELFEAIKMQTLSAHIAYGDETTHKMLEGDNTKNWYLWGFFSENSCYFELHNTRSGDIPLEFMKNSSAKYFMCDAYPGYKKAIREAKEKYDKDIIEVNCNAHAFRYFEEACANNDESNSFLEIYKKIFDLEHKKRDQENKIDKDELLSFRQQMLPHYEELKLKCEKSLPEAMPGGFFKKAISYYLNHYKELTSCTQNIDVPLTNNLSERELRGPVVGRKTWIGTHSKRGAKTAAVMFTIVQSCKLNNINPRKYLPWIVERIHKGEKILTPYDYSLIPDSG